MRSSSSSLRKSWAALMPKPKFGGFKGLGRATGVAVGKIAIKVYVCHGCGLEHKGVRPQQCKSCGRMDFAKYDSVGEAGRYAQLRLMVMAGLITNLETQVRFPLMTVGANKLPFKVATYIADFVYIRDGSQIIEDFKGALTDVAALKLRWMAGQGLPVSIVTAKGKHS